MSVHRRRRIPKSFPSLASLLTSLLPFNLALAQNSGNSSAATWSTPHAEVARDTSAAASISPLRSRIIVGYRNGFIPGDAEVRAATAGANLTQRHDRFGIAVVDGTASALADLRKDPTVEFAVADRLVSAHVLTVRQGAATQPVAHRMLFPILFPRIPRLLPSAPKKIHFGDADRFYRATPQAWAVKAVGGFGNSIAGGPLNGPWKVSMGQGVRIAILDSGVDRNHPDIQPNLALNLSEIDSKALPSPCDDGSPQDQQGHGSWAASLAAGAAGQSTGQVIGVAPSAVILNIKVLERMPGNGSSIQERCANGQASGMVSWVLQGIQDAVAQHADVISLSLGSVVDLYSADGAGLKAAFDRATHAASAAGVIVVASAGNESFDLSSPRYVELPAQARDVLAVVASTNPACAEDLHPGTSCHAGPVTMPYYSNTGSGLSAIAAPGGSYPDGSDYSVSGWVRGACSTGLVGTLDGAPTDANHSFGCFNLGHQQYLQAIGTSASAPLVAGVAALVRSAHPSWSATTVLQALRSTAVPSASMPFGQVSAAAALAYDPGAPKP